MGLFPSQFANWLGKYVPCAQVARNDESPVGDLPTVCALFRANVFRKRAFIFGKMRYNIEWGLSTPLF
jgi:hypothetical protein